MIFKKLNKLIYGSCEKYRKDFLKMVYNKKNIEVVAFVIDSPGGSAVYSAIIGDSMRKFCDKNNKKLLTFSESVSGSGGYWLLCIGKLIN